MLTKEWSRSRYWLCHFLNNRHDRVRVRWDACVETDPALQAALARWLVSPSVADLLRDPSLARAMADAYPQDPAYVQCVRLLTKEGLYHADLLDRVARHLATLRQPAATIDRLTAAMLRLPGARFQLSVLLLSDLIQVPLARLIQHATSDRAVAASASMIARDRRAHAAFYAERLTVELADLNFIRRNLRRLRLRGMFAVMLVLALAWHSDLILATGSSRWRFAFDAINRFRRMLERVVPYRRDALLHALGVQRERPFDGSVDAIL